MKLMLTFILLILSLHCFAQGIDMVEQSEEPCRSSLIQLHDLWTQEKATYSTVEKAYSLTEQYRKYDLEESCGTVNGLESKFLADIIITANDSSAVDFYFKHIESYKGSASEPLNDHFERILVNFPSSAVRRAESKSEEERNELAFRVAFGFLNNTYSESQEEPVQYFWKRHQTLSEEFSDSKFVQLIISSINQIK